MTGVVFTVGHSTHSPEAFLALLRRHEITAVCDVRSAPYSRFNPQFNRDFLEKSLKSEDVAYVFLGKELGARTKDRSCYSGGKVQYELLAETDLFRRGIERLKEGIRRYRIALMCAEKDPLDCHRTILVARRLVENGVPVAHILADGELETHEAALKRLMALLRMPENDLLRPREEIIADAYLRQGDAIAYSEEGAGRAHETAQLRDTELLR